MLRIANAAKSAASRPSSAPLGSVGNASSGCTGTTRVLLSRGIHAGGGGFGGAMVAAPARSAPSLMLYRCHHSRIASRAAQQTYHRMSSGCSVVPSLLFHTRIVGCGRPTTHSLALRSLSSNPGGGGGGGGDKASSSSSSSGGGGGGGESAKTGAAGAEGDAAASQELVQLTPGQKVVAGTRLTMWAGIAVFAGFCAYYIGRELLPSKMSPNSVFDSATNVVRNHPEVKARFGEPLKAYGRDHGGHREGRRNFVEHTQYEDKEDGSKRTRVRFNLEGQFGTAFVFAEVSSDMASGEFVYVIVQDKRNGQVITVVDNRSAITAARMAGGSKEGMDAFSKLLGGGGGGGGGRA